MTTDLFTPPDLIRGNVKAAMTSVGASSADLWNVHPSRLRFIEGFNGRVQGPEYEAHVEAITQSILDNGYYQDKPIAAYVAKEDDEQVIYVTDGHTRATAALRAIERGAPLETVPVVVKPKGTTLEDLTFALVTSNNGKPFTPYETALIVKRLIDMGVVEKVIAKRLNLTSTYVNSLLELVAAPKAIRDMVVAGQVSATEAIKELNKHGKQAVPRLKEALKTAQAAGKSKVTGKHLPKPKKAAPVRFEGSVAAFTAQSMTITGTWTSSLNKGDKVVVTVIKADEAL